MNATITRGRRILAVLATTSTLLLPAVGASAAPAEQANERATAAQEQEKNDKATAAQEQRTERQDADRGAPDDGGTDEGWTEDNDTNDGGTPNNVVDDGDNEHPSGKDRSVEHGRSGNQGNAQSDPDDDGRGPDRSNGGADKPNGDGGVDKADQDRNNGCGNDDDFEDDNEGLCGGNPDRGPQDDTDVDDDDVVEDDDETEDGNDVSGNDDAGDEQTGDTGNRTVDGEIVVGGDQDDRTSTPPFVVEEGVLSEVVTRDDAPGVAIGVTTEDLGEVAAAGTAGVTNAALDADTIGAADHGALPRTGAGLAGLAVLGLTTLAGGTALSRRHS